MQDLPVNGRNFIRLVQLVPGATEGAANSMLSGNRPDDRRITSSVSINGAPDNQNNQMIDGIDNNERGIGTIGVKPSMDAIAEVRVQTNLYSAETGRTGGGIVNILTKSGTNAFHGTAYEFLRNDCSTSATTSRRRIRCSSRTSSAAASAVPSSRTGRSSSATTRA